MKLRLLGTLAAAVATSALVTVIASTAATAVARRARADSASACADPLIAAPRDPANPLALPTAPTDGDPLQGAHFFVDGPAHGAAAGAIAQLVAVNPRSYPDSYSWAQLQADLSPGGPLYPKLAANPAVAAKVAALSKIAAQEETQNVSLYAHGGGFGGVRAQTIKLLCDNMQADPTPAAVPVLSTFFIYPHGRFCPTLAEIRAWQQTFKADVEGMASAIGRRRAVILTEIDSLGAGGCLKGRALTAWVGDLRFENRRLSELPHVVVYQEAGYSDASGPRWTARQLWRAGVSRIEGFFTNGTHFAWSSNEIAWAERISDLLWARSRHRYRAHFVVNTAQNGRGPLRPRNVVRSGNEVLCNPPGRGLGRIPTAQTEPTFDGYRFPLLDAFLWTGVPGRSHNSDCPGGPWASAGVFDPRFAIELGSNANQQLGPAYPSEPY